MVEVVIAVRGGPDAKSRCADALSASERAVLTEVMLQDMLDAIESAAGVTGTWVVTPTASLAAAAARRGARIIRQDGVLGLNAAFELALDALAEHAPYAPAALLMGDLPMLAASELDAAVALARTHPVVLAPAHADGGTGVIVLQAGARIPLAFGPGSFERHAAGARASGHALAVVEANSLGRDVDRAEDLAAVVQAAPQTRTARFLQARLIGRVRS